MKAARTRIAPNIAQYPDGRYEVRVSAAGRVAPPTRFTADTPLDQIARWRDQARERLKREARALGETGETKHRRGTGTLRTTAPDYLAQIGGRPSTAADTSHLRAWFEVVIDGVTLGDLPLTAWTAAHVNKTTAQWKQAPTPRTIRRVKVAGYTWQQGRHAGRVIAPQERARPATSGHTVAAYTIRHRLRVLRDFFRTMTGEAGPVAQVKRPPPPKTPPTTVAPERVTAVLEQLAAIDASTFARFFVAAVTGQRPCQIARAHASDVNLDADLPYWLVRNAKGEPAHSIALNPVQERAWRFFIQVDAWGWFNTTTYGRRIHRAGWPIGIRPYAARHSIAKAALERGAHLGDVQALLGHLDPATTRIYAPFQLEEQQRISAQLGGRRPHTVSRPKGAYLGEVLRPRLATKKSR
jgi:integrase